MDDQTTFHIDTQKIIRILIQCVVGLMLAYVATRIYTFITGDKRAHGLIALFNLDIEGTVPTFFNALLLFFCASLLMTIAALKRKHKDGLTRQWAWLGLIFLYLSFDEAAGIHELMVIPMQRFIGNKGIFYHAWIVPGAAAVVILGLLFSKFWFSLPKKTKKFMLLAAVVYISGALGLEAIGGYIKYVADDQHFFYALEVILEEALEMGGLLIFIHALVDYMKTNFSNIQEITFE
jgi:hypothetical protein